MEIADAPAEYDTALLAAIGEQRRRVAALRHQDGGDRVGAFGGPRHVEIERPSARPYCHGQADRFRKQSVAPKHVRHPFRRQEVERLAQREQQLQGRCAGVFLVMHLAVARRPVPIRGAQPGTPMSGTSALAGGDEAQAGRRHQSFLRSSHCHVDAPLIHGEGNRAKRSNGVDHQQSRMACFLNRFPDRGNVVYDARCGVDVDGEDRLDGAAAVAAQTRFELGGPHGAAPVAREHLDVAAELRSHLAPAQREPAAFEHQNLVAARQHVRERCFPGPMAVGDVNVGAAASAEQRAKIGDQAVGQRKQRPRVDVDGRAMHRPQHLVRQRGRPGDGQKLAPRSNDHGDIDYRRPARHPPDCDERMGPRKQ